MDTALADSLESMHPDAFGWAVHCCGGDAGQAEDVLQSSYQKLAAGRLRFEGRSSLKTWWFGVIRFTAMEEQRRALFRQSLLGRLAAVFAEDHHPPPTRQIALSEQAAELRAALRMLPPRQAEVLHLVFYQNLTLSQAAEIMRVGIGSARQHYERGKARLRQLITEDSCHEC